MKEIPLKVFARQSLSVMLEQSLYEISLKECNGIMAATIIRDGVTLISNRRICAGMTIIPEGYLEEGNFVILTENGEIPYYTDFESSNVFVYLTLQEIEELRLMEYTGPAPNTIPSGPLVDFNYLTGKLAYGMKLERASSATYISGGVLKTAAANMARFEDNGLLIESKSENLLLQSGDPSNPYWSKTRASITQVPSGAPSGEASGKLTPDTSLGTHSLSRTYSYKANTDYIFSVFLKSSGYDFAQVQIGNFANQVNPQSVFVDLENKIILAADMSRISIQPLVKGWVRVSTKVTSASTSGTLLAPTILASTGMTGVGSTFSGDGNNGIEIWGLSLEESQALPTSYMPTVSNTFVRERDALSLTQSGAKWLYREYVPFGGSLIKELIPYAGELCPPGHLQKLKAWNRDLTTDEIKSLGVTNV